MVEIAPDKVKLAFPLFKLVLILTFLTLILFVLQNRDAVMFSQLFHLLSVAVHVALVFSLPSAVPLFKRAPAQVITKCTAPNTVALTFVSF